MLKSLSNYGYVSPWREIQQLQQEMNRLFTDAFSLSGGRSAPSYPAVNVWTNDDGAVVTVELPGISPKDIDISVSGDILTLRGNRAPEETAEGATYHRRERSYGPFARTIQLPFAVEANKVKAMFEKGVLHISLPPAEAVKPKKIAVKTA